MDQKVLVQAPSPISQKPHRETKLCIIIDSSTPIIMKVPYSAESITLKQFKEFAMLKDESYKFYFKSLDSEFGLVKEEVVDDFSTLPNDGDRIVAWVISDKTNQSYLFGEAKNNSNQIKLDDKTSTLSETFSNETTYSNYQNSLYIRVRLNLSNYNFLGLTLVGPSDDACSTDKGIYVGEIGKGSVVEQDGSIEVGDRVIEINGLDLRGVNNDDAVATFRNCIAMRGAIDLVLERNLQSRGRFTLPREYVSGMNQQASPKSIQDMEHLPVPFTFGDDLTQTNPKTNNRLIRGTHSLPRSITPKSLYAASNFENHDSANVRPRHDSRSVYETNTPSSIRQLDVMLHCARDDIYTIYSAIKSDAKSLEIKDREWLRVIIKQAFLGSSLIKWLSRNVYGFNNRREIKRYANQMLTIGLIRNPMTSGTFSEKCLYTLSY